MDIKNLGLNTFIPEMYKTINYNFASTKRYLDVIYNETLGVVVVPINTTGRVKAASGEFVNVTTDNLIIRNQFTNIYSNVTTANLDLYNTIKGAEAIYRDPSTWELPNFKYIDVVKPYYKIKGGQQIALRCPVVSQIVELILDSDGGNFADFTILLEQTGASYAVNSSQLGDTVKLICMSYDVSTGNTWVPLKQR
jgi:hypothetical protein